jgi:signal transduction histidine kinase/ActR/RegA family two-component response regulator
MEAAVPKGEPSLLGLLQFARALQQAHSFADLVDIARSEVLSVTGYAHAWLLVRDQDDENKLRLLDVSGIERDKVWDFARILTVAGDPFLEELLSSNTPVVIEDARTDPRTNKQMVEQLQNRTLINIPLVLVDVPFGAFGVGTFGDEGCRAPTESELSYLVGMASQISVAASRIRFLEIKARDTRARLELERRIAQVQKLESLGLLAGGIAHDFNNLLTVIVASAGMAEPLCEDPEVLVEIRAVLEAATRANGLTQQLLAMSRSQELSLLPLDMNEVLRKLLVLVRRVLPESISLELLEGQAIPLVEGDMSQVEQVFMNLFINARDAMPEGGQLTVETELVLVNGRYAESHPWAKPGRYVLVTVTDTGTGMSREVLERVFEPFFTTKGPRAGTGLGLAVSYGIVRQHRGMLHAYSEVGVGTSFKVYLPAAERLAAAVGSKLQASPVAGQGYILLAEDDEAVRAVAARLLERGGYRVKVVENGNAACRAVAEERFDLVLLDVVMPGMPCRKTVQFIRDLRPEQRILLSSGYTAGEAVTGLIAETGLQILRKPYDPDHMLRVVQQVLATSADGAGS